MGMYMVPGIHSMVQDTLGLLRYLSKAQSDSIFVFDGYELTSKGVIVRFRRSPL